MVMVGLPAPVIRAPIALRKCARSTTSGSQAALSIMVTPCARTAAIMTLAVPGQAAPARPPGKSPPPAGQAGGGGADITAFDRQARAQLIEPFQVEVNRPRADDTAARQGDAGAAQPSNQR